MNPLDWVIVGGGPHGVHLAIRLIGEAGVAPESIRIIDPAPRLMDAWYRCSENTGMTHLRSPGVHHLDLDPFSLLRFGKLMAHERGSGQGLFARPYNRPSVGLFAAHCQQLIQDYGLEKLHIHERVSGIEVTCDGVEVTTESGEPLHAERVLLAMGAGERARWPDWAKDLDSDAVQHIFDRNFELDPAAWPKRVAVVGGGITAAQTALRLVGGDRKVTLVSRHPLRKHQFDSEPGWVGPKFMRKFLKTPEPAKRRQIIGQARHRGSMSPDIHRRINRAINAGDITHIQSDIQGATSTPDEIRLLTETGPLDVDVVLLATGFESCRPGGALVDQLIQSNALPCSTCGYPVVDEHLRWHPRIFVTGPLAELEVGPVSRNLIGARRAAERIVPVASTAPTFRAR